MSVTWLYFFALLCILGRGGLRAPGNKNAPLLETAITDFARSFSEFRSTMGQCRDYGLPIGSWHYNSRSGQTQPPTTGPLTHGQFLHGVATSNSSNSAPSSASAHPDADRIYARLLTKWALDPSKFDIVQALYAHFRLDPFDQSGLGFDPRKCRTPDANTRACYTEVRHGYAKILGGASAVKGLMKMCMPNTSYNDCVVISCSAAGSTAPTVESTAGDFEWDDALPTSAKGTHFRIIAEAMRVVRNSCENDTSGSLRGGEAHKGLCTALNTWSDYDTELVNLCKKQYTASEGITARYAPIYNGDGDWSTTVVLPEMSWLTLGTKTLYQRSNIPSCAVYWDGIKSTTVLDVELIQIVEYACDPKLGVHPEASWSPYRNNCLSLYMATADEEVQPFATTPNSFASGMGRVLGNAFNTLRRVAGLAGPALLRGAVGALPGGSETLLGLELAQEAYRAVTRPKKKKGKSKAQLRRIPWKGA